MSTYVRQLRDDDSGDSIYPITHITAIIDGDKRTNAPTLLDCDTLYPHWKEDRKKLRDRINELEESLLQMEEN